MPDPIHQVTTAFWRCKRSGRSRHRRRQRSVMRQINSLFDSTSPSRSSGHRTSNQPSPQGITDPNQTSRLAQSCGQLVVRKSALGRSSALDLPANPPAVAGRPCSWKSPHVLDRPRGCRRPARSRWASKSRLIDRSSADGRLGFRSWSRLFTWFSRSPTPARSLRPLVGRGFRWIDASVAYEGSGDTRLAERELRCHPRGWRARRGQQAG